MTERFWVYDGRRRVPKSVTTVIIPEFGIQKIDNIAFEYCQRLVSITIPETVSEIGEWAFHRCVSLKTITLPSSIKKIGEGAFCDCVALSCIHFFPRTLDSIGYKAFCGCESLTSLKLPLKIQHLDRKVFKDCTSLKSLELPSSIQHLDGKIFKRCESLESIMIPSSSNTQIHNNVVNLLREIAIWSPKVSQTPCTIGRTYPLHLLVMYGHVRYYTDGIHRLIQTAPNTLSECDHIYNFYPFLLAASTPLNNDIDFSISDEVQHLETVYFLLRETPWLIDILIPNKSNKKGSTHH